MKWLIFKNSKVYDVLKFCAQIVLPALGTLYFAIAQIWGLPYGAQIVGTITAVDAFIGVVLGISSSQYHKAQDENVAITFLNPELHKGESDNDEE